MRLSSIFIAGLLILAACDPYPPTPKPDYTIRVMPTRDGMVAIPPGCPSNVTAVTDPYDNQPMPQFGCATARNLAFMAERPEDIVNPRELGPTSGVTMVGAVFRYNTNQTRGLIYPVSSPDLSVDVSTMSTVASPINGDVTGGLGTSSSSSSSSGISSAGATSTGASSSGGAP